MPLNADWEVLGTYHVLSTDIDIGGHMNNCAYIRALQSFFTTEEWTAIRPSVFEIHYRKPSFEQETLLFRQMKKEKTVCEDLQQ